METQIILWIVIPVLSMSPVRSTPEETINVLRHRKASQKSPRSTSGYRSSEDLLDHSQLLINAEKTDQERNYDETMSGANKPQCSPTCENGDCAQLNICDCNRDWQGESCLESLFCVVTQSVETTSPRPLRKVEGSSKATFMELKRPKCAPECDDQFSKKAFYVIYWENMTHYFLPIDAKCNTEKAYLVFLKRYEYLIGGITGIALFAIIVCIDNEYEYVEIKYNESTGCNQFGG